MAGKKDNERQNEFGALTFDEFPSPAYEDWLNRSKKFLNRLPMDRFHPELSEQIVLKPIYRSEDVEGIAHADRMRELLGRQESTWEISQPLAINDPKAFNDAAKDALQNGQTTLHIQLDRLCLLGMEPKASGKEVVHGLALTCLRDLEQALADIRWERAPVYIECGAYSFPIVSLFAALAEKQGKDLSTWRGCIGADPYAMWVSEGRLTSSSRQHFHWMAETIHWTRENAPHLQTICAKSTPYHNGGANATQELAFTLATAVDYIRELQKRDLTIEQISPQIRFSFSIQSTFFAEVAKLRAARILWAKIVDAFGGSPASQKMFIHACSSARTKTIIDPHTNILRATIEAFAAVSGGADSLQISPYTEAIDPLNKQACRIARNAQLILKEEAYLTKVSDPAAGAWCVESLTDSIAERAWTLFQQIEQMGGMKAALLQRFPQQEIEKVAEQRKKDIETRARKSIGCNVYANLAESVRFPTEHDGAVQRARASRSASFRDLRALKRHIERDPKNKFRRIIDELRGGLYVSDCYRLVREEEPERTIQTIKLEGDAASFESLRLASLRFKERTGTLPQVYLLRYGAEVDRPISADFVQQFFAAGGFETTVSENFRSIEEAASVGGAIESEAIALSIAHVPELIRDIAERIRKRKPDVYLLLVGQPSIEEADHFRKAGIIDYVHDRANCFQLLNNLQQRKGISL